MSALGKLLNDTRGLVRVVGPATTARWLGAIALSWRAIMRKGDLQPADLRMGNGPFRVRHRLGSAKVQGERVFAGIREIWVRDCYDQGMALLKLPNDATIVDLGANLGNFSMLALAANPTARLIAVEPAADLADNIERTARLNGFHGRIQVCRAFVGALTHMQTDTHHDPRYDGAQMLSEDAFLQRYDIQRIDFLKCDIEGSEYAFLEAGSRLLDLSERIAVELHSWGGDSRAFLDRLVAKGFKIRHESWTSTDCVALTSRH